MTCFRIPREVSAGCSKVERRCARLCGRTGKFFQDPKSVSVQPDEILANVLSVAAAARGFSDDRMRSIAHDIIMKLCR